MTEMKNCEIKSYKIGREMGENDREGNSRG